MATPTYRFHVDQKTRESTIATWNYMNAKGWKLAMYQTDSVVIPKARNDCVAQAKKMNAEWLMFIDSDMVFEPNYVEMLLEHDKDVVGGLCVKRVPPFNSTVYFRQSNKMYVPLDGADPSALKLNSLINVDGTGTAFLLVRMSVFDKLEQPYFAMPEGAEGGVLGEDLYFCEKLDKAGVEMYVDTGVMVGHLGEYPYTYLDRLSYLEYERLNGRSGAGVEGSTGGVCENFGTGVSSLLRASRATDEVPSESVQD